MCVLRMRKREVEIRQAWYWEQTSNSKLSCVDCLHGPLPGAVLPEMSRASERLRHPARVGLAETLPTAECCISGFDFFLPIGDGRATWSHHLCAAFVVRLSKLSSCRYTQNFIGSIRYVGRYYLIRFVFTATGTTRVSHSKPIPEDKKTWMKRRGRNVRKYLSTI